MHNDQARVKSALLPYIMDRVFSEDPLAVQDCTVLNRALYQGADPLLLSLLCPDPFQALCHALGLDEATGTAAIGDAHVRGPAVLLGSAGGIPLDLQVPGRGQDPDATPISWRKEALWLVLAGLSDTTEEGYTEGATILDRLRRMTVATAAFHALCGAATSPWGAAITSLRKFEASTTFTLNADGVPMSDVDHGFYVGYKRGFPAVAVHHGDKTFYGTVPGTTLDEQGIVVDVKVSESYGFVRDI